MLLEEEAFIQWLMHNFPWVTDSIDISHFLMCIKSAEQK